MSRTLLRRWALDVVVYVSTGRERGSRLAHPPGLPRCLYRAELALHPPPERAFHIAGCTSNFRSIPFSPLESMFRIAKIGTYLIEK
jgi:hypothetical protein